MDFSTNLLSLFHLLKHMGLSMLLAVLDIHNQMEEFERAVQTVKLLSKSSDPYLALLAYRTSPLRNGYSPSELLMGRKLRTSLPVHPKVLEPQLPDKTTVRNSEENQRKSQEEAYNQRHRSRPLRPLQEGDMVWITDCKSYGLVVRQTGHPRSYLVQTSRG